MIVIKITIELTKMNDSDLIKNPKTNRFVKRTSQTGLRLIKELSVSIQPPTPPIVSQPPTAPIAPVQTALLATCADIVVNHTPEFKNLTASETDALFKRLLLERLSIAPAKAKKPKPKKKKSHYRVQSSSSSEESD